MWWQKGYSLPGFFQPLSVIVGLQPSSSMSAGCMVQLRGDWAIFCHTGSGRVGRVWSAREKSLEILHRGWELNLGLGKDSEIHSFSHWAVCAYRYPVQTPQPSIEKWNFESGFLREAHTHSGSLPWPAFELRLLVAGPALYHWAISDYD